MQVKEIINELKEMGYDVSFRKRTDGGYIITKINNVHYRGSSGNKIARDLIGNQAQLSQASVEARIYNVNKFWKGRKKKKYEPVSDEMKKELKQVQRLFREKKVNGKITIRKLREHIKEGGKRSALDYLHKMTKYAQGYAYDENVLYLSNYAKDVAKGLSGDLKTSLLDLANYMESIKDSFKETWIHPTYEDLYAIVQSGYSEYIARESIGNIIVRIK